MVIFDEPDPLAIITYLKPDVLVKGGDWTVRPTIVGRDVVEAAEEKVISLPYVAGSSTSGIIETIISKFGK